jgi:hypothetical protein
MHGDSLTLLALYFPEMKYLNMYEYESVSIRFCLHVFQTRMYFCMHVFWIPPRLSSWCYIINYTYAGVVTTSNTLRFKHIAVLLGRRGDSSCMHFWTTIFLNMYLCMHLFWIPIDPQCSGVIINYLYLAQTVHVVKETTSTHLLPIASESVSTEIEKWSNRYLNYKNRYLRCKAPDFTIYEEGCIFDIFRCRQKP